MEMEVELVDIEGTGGELPWRGKEVVMRRWGVGSTPSLGKPALLQSFFQHHRAFLPPTAPYDKGKASAIGTPRRSSGLTPNKHYRPD